jgi:hypothetical protein
MDRRILKILGRGSPRANTTRGLQSRFQSGNVSYEVLTIVRRQPVQTFLRLATPSMTTTLDWMFGLNMRFVRRLEKLTLCPNLVVLPQTSHLPATSSSFRADVLELDLVYASLTARAETPMREPRASGWDSTRATLKPTMFAEMRTTGRILLFPGFHAWHGSRSSPIAAPISLPI